MKNIKKIGLLLIMLTITLLVVACNGGENTPSGVIESEVKDIYTSNVSVNYSNMRPMYNYYLFTINYQQVTLYEDGTYQLANMSTTHSAIIISEDDLSGYEPEEGEEVEDFSGVKSNPRDTNTIIFYGKYELEGSSLKLKQPFRIVSMIADNGGLGLSYTDTMSDWSESMNRGAFYTRNPETGEWSTNVAEADQNAIGYLKYRSFAETAITVNPSTKVMEDTVKLPNRNAEEAKAFQIDDLEEIMDKPTSPSYAKIDHAYIGVIPNIAYKELDSSNYLITFKYQTLINYSDGTYDLTENNLTIKNLKLALEGNNWEGEINGISIIRYFGKYKSVVDEYDEDAFHITILKPTRILTSITKEVSDKNLAFYYVDTNNWQSFMEQALPTSDDKTAKEFLKLNAFNELELFAMHSPGNGFTPEEFVYE